MYIDKTKTLEHSQLSSHHFLLRRALVKTIFKQIETWNSTKDQKDGRTPNPISSEEKLTLIQLWKQCAFLSDLLKTSRDNLSSKQTSTYSELSMSSKLESSTDQKSSKSSSSSSTNSVKLLFNNKVQTESSLAECVQCNHHSNKKLNTKRRRFSFKWLDKHLLRLRPGRKSKSTQRSETFDKLLQTPISEDSKNEDLKVLKNQFETCQKCGRLDLYKPLTHNEIDTIKMLIKMEAKQNYRQINIIIKELNEHKNEIKKLNSVFEQLMQKKHRSVNDVDLQEDVKALYEKYQKLSQKYSEIEQKATDVLKRPSENASKAANNKSKIPVISNKSAHQSKQRNLTERPTKVKEKDTKNLINASQKKIAPQPSSKISISPSKNASINEKTSSELSLFKDHVVYSTTGNSKMMMIRDSKEKIYYFPKKDISKIVVQKLIDVIEKEKLPHTIKKPSSTSVHCKKETDNQTSAFKNLFGFIKRRK